jgi:transglutaminase-like putative cysteine protease
LLHTGIRRIDANTFLTFALLFFALGSVAIGIGNLVRDLMPDPLLLIAVAALSLGWLLAKTKIPGWFAGIVLGLLGVLLVFLWVGDLWDLLLVWSGAIVQVSWQTLQFWDVTVVDSNAFWASLDGIKLRLTTLLTDLDLWLRALISGQPLYNYNAISLVWGFAIWLVSAWAGWCQRRKEHPWFAILPAGLLLVVSLGYTYGPTAALFPLIFASLSLAGFTIYIQREHSWKARGMDYPVEERSENLFVLFGITLGFVIAAAIIPRISIRGFLVAVQEWLNPQIEVVDPFLESFGLQGDLAPLGSMGRAMQGGLPRGHLIGAGPELSEQMVMSVALEDDIDEMRSMGVPFYWRALTYDRYTGYGWQSSEVVLQSYQAEDRILQSEALKGEAYIFLEQEYRFTEPHDFIYAAGDIVSLDTDYSIAWRIVPGITETQNSQGDFFAATQEKLAYRIQSAVPVVSEDQLQAVEGLYPSWISERYLTLPGNVSQRVVDLARQLTRNASTPYGKVRAIEAYLRAYEYQLNLPAPPSDRELSDYFLFELQKGYCDYYATSMVVLARAVGIPARIAIGYTGGQYDPGRSQFIVAEDNAHTWVEIYFSGIGWIPFEPTTAQPRIQRPIGALDFPSEAEPPTRQETYISLWETGLPDRWWRWPVSLLLGVFLLLLVWPFVDGLYLRFMAPGKMAARLYRRLYRFGSRIGSPARRGDTPYEFAETLMDQLDAISGNSPVEPYIQPAVNDLRTLADVYVYSIYSPYPLQRENIRGAAESWRRLRARLLVVRILYSWQTRFER